MFDSLLFFTLILPSLVHGVYPILPPSSLFVLITSIEAHSACPQRKRQRDTEAESRRESQGVEREHSVFIGDSLCSTFAIMAYLCTTISLQHLASDAWFILNNAAYASPDIMTYMSVCACVRAFVLICVRVPACMCVFSQLRGRPTLAPLICQLCRVAMETTEGRQK